MHVHVWRSYELVGGPSGNSCSNGVGGNGSKWALRWVTQSNCELHKEANHASEGTKYSYEKKNHSFDPTSPSHPAKMLKTNKQEKVKNAAGTLRCQIPDKVTKTAE